MSKKHQREEDVNRRLEKELKDAKAYIRVLERRLRKVDKNFSADLEEQAKEYRLKEEHTPKVIKCENCGKGEIIETNLVGRVFLRCTVCDYREKKK